MQSWPTSSNVAPFVGWLELQVIILKAWPMLEVVPDAKLCPISIFRRSIVCLYTYEFLLSLCKIARSSVILLLPLFALAWNICVIYCCYSCTIYWLYLFIMIRLRLVTQITLVLPLSLTRLKYSWVRLYLL